MSHATSPFFNIIDKGAKRWFECEDQGDSLACKGRRHFLKWLVDFSSLPVGSLYCYDATAWHRGSPYAARSAANASAKIPRTVFNAGFYGPGDITPGPLFNMFPNIIGQYFLSPV